MSGPNLLKYWSKVSIILFSRAPLLDFAAKQRRSSIVQRVHNAVVVVGVRVGRSLESGLGVHRCSFFPTEGVGMVGCGDYRAACRRVRILECSHCMSVPLSGISSWGDDVTTVLVSSPPLLAPPLWT